MTGVANTIFRKKLFAAFLLCVLSLSALPIRPLHDILAAHSDEFTGCGHESHRHETCVFDASLVCKTAQQVVDLPYDCYSVIFRHSIVRYLDRSFPFYSGRELIQYGYHSLTRGPPSSIL